MRDWIYDKVISCPSQADVAGGRVFTTGAVDGPTSEVEDIPAMPFIVIRLGVKDNTGLPGSRIKQQGAQIWVHSDPNSDTGSSMLPTDDLLRELETWLPGQAPEVVDGEVIIDCAWQFTSGDGYDDHFRSTTRYVTVLVTFKET